MTDYEMMIGMLERLKIGHRTDVSNYKPDIKTIVCEQGMEKVNGYVGFSTTFEFRLSGEFVEMGAWE